VSLRACVYVLWPCSGAQRNALEMLILIFFVSRCNREAVEPWGLLTDCPPVPLHKTSSPQSSLSFESCGARSLQCSLEGSCSRGLAFTIVSILAVLIVEGLTRLMSSSTSLGKSSPWKRGFWAHTRPDEAHQFCVKLPLQRSRPPRSHTVVDRLQVEVALPCLILYPSSASTLPRGCRQEAHWPSE